MIIWDLVTLEPKKVLPHDGAVQTVQFSPKDGRFVLTATDKEAEIWNIGDPEPNFRPVAKMHELEQKPGSLLEARFSPEGDVVALRGKGNGVTVCRLNSSPQPLCSLFLAHSEPVNSIRFLGGPSELRMITGSSDGTARIWNVRTKQSFQLEAGAPVNDAAIRQQGDLAVTAGQDGVAVVWDLQGRTPIAYLTGHHGAITHAIFTSDDKAVITTGVDGKAETWDLSQQIPSALSENSTHVQVAGFSPKGTYYLLADDDNQATVWEAATRERVAGPLAHESWVLSAAFSPEEDLLVTTAGNVAKLWSLPDGKLQHVLPGHSKAVVAATFSDDGQYIFTASLDGTWAKWEARTGHRLVTGSGTTRIDQLRLDYTQQFVLTIADRKAHIWKAWNGKELTTFWPSAAVLCGSFHPALPYVVLGSADGTARLLDYGGSVLRTYQVNKPATGKIGVGVTAIAFDHSGERVLLATADGAVTVWGTFTGTRQLTFSERHNGPVRSAEFSRDDHLAVTASDDGTARVWDAATGSVLNRLRGHSKEVTTALFSHNGGHVLTNGLDGRAYLWNLFPLTPEELRQMHAAVLSRNPFHLEFGVAQPGSLNETNLAYDHNGQAVDPGLEKTHPDSMEAAGRDAEQGRSLIEDGDLPSAAVWLAHARGMTKAPWPALDLLIYQSARQFAGLVKTVSGHRQGIWTASFNPEGTQFVTADRAGVVNLWETGSGRHMRLNGHTNSVFAARFNESGTLLATAGRDGVARLWNGSSGAGILSFDVSSAHAAETASGLVPAGLASEKQLNDIRFSPDGSAVLTAGAMESRGYGRLQVDAICYPCRIRPLSSMRHSLPMLA